MNHKKKKEKIRKMKWISVEDELPDDGTFKVVMFQTAGSSPTFLMPLMAFFFDGKWQSNGLDLEGVDLPKNGVVTYWINPPDMLGFREVD